MSCVILCEKNYTEKSINQFLEKVKQEYRVHWIIDNLPSATKKGNADSYIYEAGYALGGRREEAGEIYFVLNNHVDITLLYHPSDVDEPTGTVLSGRIVGFEVLASSVAHNVKEVASEPAKVAEGAVGPASSSGDEPLGVSSCALTLEQFTAPAPPPAAVVLSNSPKWLKVYWTYSVTWQESPIIWGARWDAYFKMVDSQIHWFSIVNSLMVVLFLSGMVAMIMMRTLHRDFGVYNAVDLDETQEESGWKLVHGDVFRSPRHPMVLAALLGTGVQTLCMVGVVMVFAVLGFLSPANRGGLMTSMVVLLMFMGAFAGYYAARSYKVFKGKLWRKTTLLTIVLYPGVTFCIFFVLNLCLAGEKSSGAVPWYICLELLALWLVVYAPLVGVGAYFGFKKPVEDPPVRVNQIPRQIPEQVWYMQPVFSVLMGGILPFGAIFIELFFILSSIWQHQFYYLFGFLFIVFVILVITCAEITIVMCYFQLCAENYRWWWRSFLTAGASSFYMFGYAVFYYVSRLQLVGFVSALLYFGYTFIMSAYFFALTGAIGFYACFWFVRKIYKEIHVD